MLSYLKKKESENDSRISLSNLNISFGSKKAKASTISNSNVISDMLTAPNDVSSHLLNKQSRCFDKNININETTVTDSSSSLFSG